MYSSQLGNASCKASFQSQMSSAARAHFQRGDVAALWMLVWSVATWHEALKSDSWNPPKMQLSAFWHETMTWKSFVPFWCLGEFRFLRLLSSVFISCSMSLFVPTPEKLCVSLKKWVCLRSLGCERAPCDLWTGQDFRFLVFNKLPFRIKATLKPCWMLNGISCYQQHKQQQMVSKSLCAFLDTSPTHSPRHRVCARTHTHTHAYQPQNSSLIILNLFSEVAILTEMS